MTKSMKSFQFFSFISYLSSWISTRSSLSFSTSFFVFLLKSQRHSNTIACLLIEKGRELEISWEAKGTHLIFSTTKFKFYERLLQGEKHISFRFNAPLCLCFYFCSLSSVAGNFDYINLIIINDYLLIVPIFFFAIFSKIGLSSKELQINYLDGLTLARSHCQEMGMCSIPILS